MLPVYGLYRFSSDTCIRRNTRHINVKWKAFIHTHTHTCWCKLKRTTIENRRRHYKFCILYFGKCGLLYLALIQLTYNIFLSPYIFSHLIVLTTGSLTHGIYFMPSYLSRLKITGMTWTDRNLTTPQHNMAYAGLNSTLLDSSILGRWWVMPVIKHYFPDWSMSCRVFGRPAWPAFTIENGQGYGGFKFESCGVSNLTHWNIVNFFQS